MASSKSLLLLSKVAKSATALTTEVINVTEMVDGKMTFANGKLRRSLFDTWVIKSCNLVNDLSFHSVKYFLFSFTPLLIRRMTEIQWILL